MILDRFAAHTGTAPHEPAVIDPSGRMVSRGELLTLACTLADTLHDLGVRPGSVVLLHTPAAGTMFHASDLAALLCGAVPANLAEHPAADQVDQMLAALRPACLIDAAADDTLAAAAARAGVSYRPLQSGTISAVSVEEALRRVRTRPQSPGACVVSTSGTTGHTRHVLISQTELTHGLDAWRNHWPLAARDARRSLAYLPVSHIAQRIMGHYLMCLYGVTVHTTTPANLATAIMTARPQLLLGVPHTLAVLARTAHEHAGLREALRTTALVLNGAAALPADTAEHLSSLGVQVAGAYGMTETTVPAFHNQLEDGSGSLGMPVPGVHADLGDDGELLLRTAYSGRYVTTWPQTVPVTGSNGWLHTGDHAELSPGGLRLTGRIAATIKTTRGHLISPELIEAHLAAQPGVTGACVLGHGKPRAVAIVSVPAAQAWDERRRTHLEQKLLSELRQARRARDLPQADIGSVLVVEQDWRADAGLLTRTGKPRRQAIADRYASQLVRRYEGQPADAR